MDHIYKHEKYGEWDLTKDAPPFSSEWEPAKIFFGAMSFVLSVIVFLVMILQYLLGVDEMLNEISKFLYDALYISIDTHTMFWIQVIVFGVLFVLGVKSIKGWEDKRKAFLEIKAKYAQEQQELEEKRKREFEEYLSLLDSGKWEAPDEIVLGIYEECKKEGILDLDNRFKVNKAKIVTKKTLTQVMCKQ